MNLTEIINYVHFGLMCLAMAIQNVLVTGSIAASMTSVEKAYKITSFHFGISLTIYNIFFSLASIPLNYMALTNKVRYITGGFLLISIGALVNIIPVFTVTPPMHSVQNDAFMCTNHTRPPNPPASMQTQNLLFIYLGYIFIGIGSSALYSLSYNHIYDTFSESISAVLIAVYMNFSVLGTSFTFLISKFVLALPFHPWRRESLNITPADENWIGAYWLLYLSGGIIMFVLFLINMILSKYITSSSNDEVFFYRKRSKII